MPNIPSNQPNKRSISVEYSACWLSEEVKPTVDRTTKHFGPDFRLEGEQRAPLAGGLGQAKPVWYVPVKKTEGQEYFPTLGIRISLLEKDGLRNVNVEGHAGKKVEVEIKNVMREGDQGDRSTNEGLRANGKFDGRGVCYIKLPGETVRGWFTRRPDGQSLRINEALVDFTFKCKDLLIDGAPLAGQSSNRIYFYRKKVVVFLPGVFGANIQLKTVDGREVGYPNFLYWGNPLGQQLGILECDDDGQPLLSPLKPTLFNMRGVVYDVFDECRRARAEYFDPVPDVFRLVELHVFAYDWRADLTAASEQLVRDLKSLQSQRADCLRNRADCDDEVALAGHSTGGVIMRHALKAVGMREIVSHAFFLNVPFRGAPKAMGVIATGQDPPGGPSMIPFVKAESLRALALTMPIVYHLAPTRKFPNRVATCPRRPASAAHDVEADKEEFATAAIDTGFIPRPIAVKAENDQGAPGPRGRETLAATADEWHELWFEYFDRERSLPIANVVSPGMDKRLRDWLLAQVKARGLGAHLKGRKLGGWNKKLASNARRFHDEAESVAQGGEWADKAYIFYSVSTTPTTLAAHLACVSEDKHSGIDSLLNAEGLLVQDMQPTWRPPRAQGTVTLPPNSKLDSRLFGPVTVPAPYVHKWYCESASRKQYRVERWQIHAEVAHWAGDGTVPIQSLLGFGGKAKVVKPIPLRPDHYKHLTTQPGGPAHVEAPNAPYVWDRIVEILQNKLDEGIYLEKNADTEKGIPEAGP